MTWDVFLGENKIENIDFLLSSGIMGLAVEIMTLLTAMHLLPPRTFAYYPREDFTWADNFYFTPRPTPVSFRKRDVNTLFIEMNNQILPQETIYKVSNFL